MKNKTWKLAALALCAALSLTACGGGAAAPTPTQSPDAAPSESQTSQTESGYTPRTVRIGTVGGSGGYSVLSDNGEWSGVDGDLWKEIVERTGWEIEIQQVEFSGTWGELDAGRIDVASNFWAINDTRKEKYNVTIPYAADVQQIVVPEDRTDLNTFEDLRGASIAVYQGQSAQFTLQAIADQYDFNIVIYEDAAAGMQDMLLGRVDAYAANITYFNDYCETHDVKVHTLEEELSQVNVGLYTAKTDEGAALVEELNQVLQEMLDDGTVSAICEKWLGMDLTQYIS